MTQKFKYTGQHRDERMIPGVAVVKKGSVVEATGPEHADAIKDTGLFEPVKADDAPKTAQEGGKK